MAEKHVQTPYRLVSSPVDSTQNKEDLKVSTGDFVKGLQTLNPAIRELMRITGAQGLSLGVYQKGQATYYANFGHRHVEKKLPVSEKTIFPACSLTKLFTSMAMSLAIDQGHENLSWDTRVREILPDFSVKDNMIREYTTITDILAHRTGMSCGHGRLGCENNFVISHADTMKYVNDQVPVLPFRQQFLYNNLGYEIAGLILDKISGSWAETFRKELFGPLGMKRSFTGRPPVGTENVSKAYNILDDASPVVIPTVKAGEGSFGGASGGVFTCVEDLLNAYAAIMDRMKSHEQHKCPPRDDTPNTQFRKLFSAHIPMAQPSSLEASYAMGLCRVQLPGNMGQIGLNSDLLGAINMPVVAKGAPSQLVFYHQGSLPGALSAIAILPELDTAIVVLSNSLALADCPDWVLQLVMEEILQARQRNNYLEEARRTVASALRWYPRVAEEIRRSQEIGRPSQSLESYVGTYWNDGHYVNIQVTMRKGQLCWALQGLASELFELEHHSEHIFHWLKPRNYLAARGCWTPREWTFFLLRFNADENAQIVSVTWDHEGNVPEGETFYKDMYKDNES